MEKLFEKKNDVEKNINEKNSQMARKRKKVLEILNNTKNTSLSPVIGKRIIF